MANILIVDDEALLRGAYARALVLMGHQVSEAASGAEANALFLRSKPDLIITDLMMPEEKSIETIMALHRDNLEIPVIAMSGHSEKNPVVVDYVAKLGAMKMLTKPFTLAQLNVAVSAALAE